jgi:uncharacterized protein YozE (UPF0346 family)
MSMNFAKDTLCERNHISAGDLREEGFEQKVFPAQSFQQNVLNDYLRLQKLFVGFQTTTVMTLNSMIDQN